MKTTIKIAVIAIIGMSLRVSAQKEYYVTEKSNEYSNGDVFIFSHSGDTYGLTMRPYNSNFNGGTFDWHKDFGYRGDLNNWYVETNFGIGTTDPKEKLHVNGSVRGHIGTGALRVQTSTGYIDVGAQNSSWAHIYTDRPKIIFNKDIYTLTNAFSSYNNDLILN